MKTSIFSVKSFNSAAKESRKELKGTFANPFVICNLLNKAAKGDFSKVENAENVTRENLARVAAELKRQHGGRYPFTFDFLTGSGLFGKFDGVLCSVYDAPQSAKNDLLHGDTITDGKGRELCINSAGDVIAKGRAVSLTVSGLFGAFCRAAKVEIVTNEKAAKAAEKAAQKAAKEKAAFEKMRRAVCSVFTDDVARLFTDDEIREKYAAIKAARVRK